MRRKSLLFALLTTLCCVLLVASARSADLETADLQTGLVAYYTFEDGSATDSSGYGNNGTIFGTTPTTGMVGNGLSFNGAGDYIHVPHSPSLGLSKEFTISGWAKPAGLYNNWAIILTKSNNRSMLSPYSVIYWSSDLTPYVRFASDQNQVIEHFLSFDGIVFNQWSFFVCVTLAE